MPDPLFFFLLWAARHNADAIHALSLSRSPLVDWVVLGGVQRPLEQRWLRMRNLHISASRRLKRAPAPGAYRPVTDHKRFISGAGEPGLADNYFSGGILPVPKQDARSSLNRLCPEKWKCGRHRARPSRTCGSLSLAPADASFAAEGLPSGAFRGVGVKRAMPHLSRHQRPASLKPPSSKAIGAMGRNRRSKSPTRFARLIGACPGGGRRPPFSGRNFFKFIFFIVLFSRWGWRP